MPAIDFDTVFSGKNNLTPLESIELFLLEQQRLRIEKQNILRRKPSEPSRRKDAYDLGLRLPAQRLVKTVCSA
jgi:hypothetical protein